MCFLYAIKNYHFLSKNYPKTHFYISISYHYIVKATAKLIIFLIIQ